MNIVTNRDQALDLYKRFYPNPACVQQDSQFRDACCCYNRDTPWFIVENDVLLPLQITEVGDVEWWGGHYVEQVVLCGSFDVLERLLGWVSKLRNNLGYVSCPCPHTVESSNPTMKLDLSGFASWNEWFGALPKKRRWEYRDTSKKATTELAAFDKVGPYLDLLEVGFTLHGPNEESYFKIPYFRETTRALVEHMWNHSGVQAIVRKQGDVVVGLALVSKDKWANELLWMFSASCHDVSSLGKALMIDVAKVAFDLGLCKVNGMAGDCSKSQVGFNPIPTWSVVKHDS